MHAHTEIYFLNAFNSNLWNNNNNNNNDNNMKTHIGLTNAHRKQIEPFTHTHNTAKISDSMRRAGTEMIRDSPK